MIEPQPCVCCGEPNQTSQCNGLTVCFPCYETGLFAEWLEMNKSKKPTQPGESDIDKDGPLRLEQQEGDVNE